MWRREEVFFVSSGRESVVETAEGEDRGDGLGESEGEDEDEDTEGGRRGPGTGTE